VNNVSISASFEQPNDSRKYWNMIYQTVDTTLEKYDADVSAAEAHGIAAGMLCVELRADAGQWLQEICGDEHELIDDDKTLLIDLFERSRELLNPEYEDFDFDLFLPDEDEPLFVQVEAIRCWCQGFLFGVGFAQGGGGWPGASGEVMRDLIEFTKIDPQVEDEDDANALMQIHEYLRAATFVVRDQFIEHRAESMH